MAIPERDENTTSKSKTVWKMASITAVSVIIGIIIGMATNHLFVRLSPQSTILEKDSPPPSITLTPVRVPIQVNARGGETREGDVVFDAPDGTIITGTSIDWRPNSDGEHDIQITTQTDKKVVAHWRARSVEVKVGPIVVDTKNALVNADLVIQLKSQKSK